MSTATLEQPRPTKGEVIQDADQPGQDLLERTSDHLRAGGLNTTPEDLDPTHQTTLNKIMEDIGDTVSVATNAVGSTIQEGMGEGTERIKLAEGLGWRQRLAQRIKGKIPFFRRK